MAKAKLMLDPAVEKPGKLVKIVKWGAAAAILAVGIFALSGGAKLGNKGQLREQSGMFNTNGVPYPIRLANYQGNSLVPVTARAAGTLRWSREFRSIDEQLLLVPQAVLVRGDYLGVQSVKNLLVFDGEGKFKFQETIAQNTPAVFGAEAMAYLTPSGLLEYKDYSANLILEAKEVPAFREWAFLLLLKPDAEALLAAVQFTGGPQRDPLEYDVYSVPIDKTARSWSYQGEGELSRAFLSSDGTTIYLLRNCTVIMLSAADGGNLGEFDLHLSIVKSAVIDIAGNLMIVGLSQGENPNELLSVFDSNGKALWSYPFQTSASEQPPACRNDSNMLIIDGSILKCVGQNGLLWEFPLPGSQKTWVTVDASDNALCLGGGYLTVINKNGGKEFEFTFKDANEAFYAPPSIDAKGRIYVAGTEKLYCIE